MIKANLKKKRRTKQRENARKAFIYFALSFFAFIALIPLYYLCITAMKDLNEAATQATMFPHSFALWDNIKFVLTHPDYKIARMFLNTMFIFALKTLGTIITCSLAAYGFAFYKFPGKNVIFFILLSTMMIPGELLGIPIYEFMVNAGLKEVAYIPLWIAAWFGTDIFVIFMFKQFFQTIPKALIEAARVDGYGEVAIFFKIVLPLNMPVITTVIILYFVGTYNDLYGPALYISDKSNWVMANSISIFENLYREGGSSSYIIPWNYVSVASLISLIPVVLLFSFMQKKFLQSIAGVGLKG
ncbi:MAG: carbohydrate ABC transporter permease [Bacilli bacterium]|jgi:multiple sugar transport system permease protein